VREPGLVALARARGAPRVWAIGGGKGGVGKSIVTASLAVALATLGRRCVLVDGDLGGANLHTLLGVERPARTLSDFLSGKVATLRGVAGDTSFPDLALVSGTRALMDMANPSYNHKLKLIRHLRGLDADDVLLDLGAGTAFNVLDFFVAAERGILVITPEPTSIENAYHFVKAAFFRSLRHVARRSSVRPVLDRVLAERSRRGVWSPRDFVAAVSEIDPAAGQLLREQAAAFTPMLLVNGARRGEDRRIGPVIAQTCWTFLGIRVGYLGALDWDEALMQVVREHRPIWELFPDCVFARGIEAIAERFLETDRGAREAGSARLAPDLTLSAPAGGGPDLAQPGAALRRRRQQLGLTLEQAIEQTRIRCLEHLECARFERLPPEPYLRGFLRSYARELRMPNGNALVARYLEGYRRALRAPDVTDPPAEVAR
jgi:flagellar biosynthesis protein FlhG